MPATPPISIDTRAAHVTDTAPDQTPEQASRGAAAQLLNARLVGREQPLAELMGVIRRAIAEREPRAITVVAPTGLGKTRLLEELVRESERVHGGEVRVLLGRIHPAGSAFSVVGSLLKARFGMRDVGPDDREAHLRRSVSEVLGDYRVSEFLHFLGGYLDIRFSESPLAQAMDDDPLPLSQVRQAVLRRFLEMDAGQAPLVLIFDDITEAPAELLDLLSYLTTTLRGSPIVLCFAAREEVLRQRPDWPGAGQHQLLHLPPLNEVDAGTLVRESLTGGPDVPDELVHAVATAAGGSPYLVRETLRTYFDAGVLTTEPEGRVRVDLGRLADVAAPTSIDQARDQRLASLSPAESSLLAKAACVGDVFWLDAMVALEHQDHAPPDLWGGQDSRTTDYAPMLEALAAREFVVLNPEPLVPLAVEYAFCQRAEWEALQARVGLAERRRSHATVAEWLEARLPDRHEAHLELLAKHHEAGGHLDDAGRYWVRAGSLARARNATVRSIECFRRGVPLLRESDVVLQLEALHDFGDALQRTGDHEGAVARFRDMLAIAYRLGLKAKGGVAHNRIGRVYRASGRLDEALRHLGTAHALFDAAGDQRGIAASFDDVGQVHLLRGDYVSALRFAQRSVELRRELGEPRSLALSLDNLGAVYLATGAGDRANEVIEQSLALRRHVGDDVGIAASLSNLGRVHRDNGQHARAQELFEEALDVARNVGDNVLEARVLTLLGEGHSRLVDPEAAIARLTEADRMVVGLGDSLLEGAVLRGLAEAQLMMQEPEVARQYIDKAIALFESMRSQPALARALVTRGEIEAATGAAQRAKAAFDQALEIFERIGDEVGLADACSAFATVVSQTPEIEADPEELARRSRTVRARLRESGEHPSEARESVS